MGYTHYWTPSVPLTEEEWREFSQGVLRVCAHTEASGVALLHRYDESGSHPQISPQKIRFNGAGDDGHETFVLARTDPAWRFCKTAGKPYDVAVTAILCFLDSVHPEKFAATSDGGPEDWQDGLALAKKSWPSKSNILDVPRGVRVRTSD